jgi:hypothetical protein
VQLHEQAMKTVEIHCVKVRLADDAVASSNLQNRMRMEIFLEDDPAENKIKDIDDLLPTV